VVVETCALSMFEIIIISENESESSDLPVNSLHPINNGKAAQNSKYQCDEL